MAKYCLLGEPIKAKGLEIRGKTIVEANSPIEGLQALMSSDDTVERIIEEQNGWIKEYASVGNDVDNYLFDYLLEIKESHVQIVEWSEISKTLDR